ncbi:MAG: hypothetical protein PHW20_04795, partial [Clostridia bacterium]|nr:hypothetical protein [Clostridia bacterium]
MKKIIVILSCIFIVNTGLANSNQKDNRWEINKTGGITWNVDSRIPHHDHIEMSGEQISVVLR